MVSFKTIAKAGEHTPERMIDYEHKSLYDIADRNASILDYEIFESTNLSKYDNDNATGVIILVDVDGIGKCTTVTHAKSIVRIFQNLKKRGITVNELSTMESSTIQFHLGEVEVNGKKYPQWQIN